MSHVTHVNESSYYVTGGMSHVAHGGMSHVTHVEGLQGGLVMSHMQRGLVMSHIILHPFVRHDSFTCET